MWISSDNCKSGPGKTEFENVLFIALERWEWRSPKAYCTHVKATNLLVEQPIKMYWNLSLTCASGRALSPIQSRGRSMAGNLLQHLLGKRAVVSPRHLEQTAPGVWRCSVTPCLWVCKFLLTMTKTEAACNGLTQWKRSILWFCIWQSYSFLPQKLPKTY